MKWLFFLIIVSVCVYMVYSTRDAIIRQMTSSTLDTSQFKPATDEENDSNNLESNSLNVIGNIKNN